MLAGERARERHREARAGGVEEVDGLHAESERPAALGLVAVGAADDVDAGLGDEVQRAAAVCDGEERVQHVGDEADLDAAAA